MKHVGCFSGGKDSTALMLWMRENIGVPGEDWTPVFCDTGWEHPITYAYVEEINRTVLNGSLVTLTSKKYPNGFVQLAVLKGRVPSAKARFCTEALKVLPMIAYLKTLNDEATAYQGIRADESASRAAMLPRQWSDDYDAWIERPLLRWTADECFKFSRKHGVKPNPLYLMGAGRVGCFPCVMVNMRELKAYLSGEVGAELKRRILDLERLVGRSFFEPTYIPERFCTGVDEQTCGECGGSLVSYRYADGLRDEEWEDQFGNDKQPPEREEVEIVCPTCKGSGKSRKTFPWAEDVFRYIESVDENQLPLLPARSCMSIYNLCE